MGGVVEVFFWNALCTWLFVHTESETCSTASYCVSHHCLLASIHSTGSWGGLILNTFSVARPPHLHKARQENQLRIQQNKYKITFFSKLFHPWTPLCQVAPPLLDLLLPLCLINKTCTLSLMLCVDLCMAAGSIMSCTCMFVAPAF